MQYLRLPLLVGCGQLYLLSNQIAGFFFYHQDLWKKLIDILIFQHGVSYQEAIASEATTLAWVDHQYLWKELDILDVLRGNNYQGKVAVVTTTFGWM